MLSQASGEKAEGEEGDEAFQEGESEKGIYFCTWIYGFIHKRHVRALRCAALRRNQSRPSFVAGVFCFTLECTAAAQQYSIGT